MLSTQLIILSYPVILFHWCSTKVSLETYPLCYDEFGVWINTMVAKTLQKLTHKISNHWPQKIPIPNWIINSESITYSNSSHCPTNNESLTNKIVSMFILLLKKTPTWNNKSTKKCLHQFYSVEKIISSFTMESVCQMQNIRI